MKESDIRPKELLDEYLRLSAEDTRRFFPDPSSWSPRPCPGCESTLTAATFEKNGFPVTRCPSCGSLYVTRVPPANQLAEFYRASPSQKFWAEEFFPAVAEARRAKIFRPRVDQARELLRRAAVATSTIVDVGAGAGVFLEECRALKFGDTWRAVEPNEILAQACREKGLETFAGFAHEAAEGWQGNADLVTSFEVVEHLVDPASFLRELSALVKPGGILLLTGICGTGFDILVLGRHAKAVFPPHHLTFLSHRGVSAMLQRCGLEELLFLTPGQLDVDIVRNACAADPSAVAEPFLHHLLFAAEDDQRDQFQRFLSSARLSSHMWIVARRPFG